MQNLLIQLCQSVLVRTPNSQIHKNNRTAKKYSYYRTEFGYHNLVTHLHPKVHPYNPPQSRVPSTQQSQFLLFNTLVHKMQTKSYDDKRQVAWIKEDIGGYTKRIHLCKKQKRNQ